MREEAGYPPDSGSLFPLQGHCLQILILDEATSSIDTETELLLQKGLNELLKGRTSFIIAHRLSTIKNADCILYVDKGDILERGNHDALMEQKGEYYKLYMSQYDFLK